MKCMTVADVATATWMSRLCMRKICIGWPPDALKPRLEDGMIQILPHRDGIEGFFIARMIRRGV